MRQAACIYSNFRSPLGRENEQTASYIDNVDVRTPRYTTYRYLLGIVQPSQALPYAVELGNPRNPIIGPGIPENAFSSRPLSYPGS